MSEMPDFMQLLEHYSGHPWILSALIFFFTFILEDAATISAALLASYEKIPALMAYMALLSGIVLGDVGLYGLGYLASRYQWARRMLERKRVALVHDWLDQREVAAVIAARFVPGARLPTYTAMGFFNLSFTKFLWAVFFASAIWTSVLFVAIYHLGMLVVEELEAWRWPIVAGLILFVILAPKLFQLLNRKKEL